MSISAYTKDKVVKDVSSQVKVFNVEDHFKGPKEKFKPLYGYLRDKIFAFDPRFKENPRAPYIGFMLGEQFGTKTVVYVHIQSNKIRLDIPKIRPSHVNDSLKKLRYKKGSEEHWHTPISEFNVLSEEDADYAAIILKEVLAKFFK